MPAAWHQQEKLVANPKLGCSGREAATGPRQHQIQAWQCRLQATNDDPRKEKKRKETKKKTITLKQIRQLPIPDLHPQKSDEVSLTLTLLFQIDRKNLSRFLYSLSRCSGLSNHHSAKAITGISSKIKKMAITGGDAV